MRSTTIACALAIALAGCGDYINASDYSGPGSTTALDDYPEVTSLKHYPLGAVMERYVRKTQNGVLMDYDGLAADPEARYLLGQYLSALASVDPSKLESPAERLAYWINGYNAAVVLGVVEAYQGESTFRVADSGSFFDTPLYTYGGITMTLNHVENVIVRGDTQHASAKGLSAENLARFAIWHKELWPDGNVDARIHAGFNCAALSCPDLLSERPFVFTAETLDQQLEKNVKAWLDAPKGASADGISQLFSWYGGDFEAHSGSIEAFITKYRTNGTQGIDLKKFAKYDWTLNIASSAPSS